MTGRTLTETLEATLREAILDGSFAPGEKLPSESALIDRYGVSRTVVRESISRLTAAGLVETYRGRGSYVLTVPSGEGFRIEPADVRSLADRLELHDFRLGCEVETAALAATRAEPDQIASITDALSTFRNATSHPRRALEADFRFHLAIATASNNRHFRDLIAALGPTMIAMPRVRLEIQGADGSDHALGRAVHEHEAILRAIRRHDPVAAGAAMRMHLIESRERLERGSS